MASVKAVFLGKREIVLGAWEFWFEPESAVSYLPGQYADFLFPFHIDDPHGVQGRTFTLTSHPASSELRFITRLEEPLGSYKKALAGLQPGQSMEIAGTGGNAILPAAHDVPLVFIMQGIGIASLLSILAECEIANLAHPITLFWKRRANETALLQGVAGQRYIMAQYDYAPQEILDLSNVSVVLRKKSKVYLSGSPEFVETTGKKLLQAGIPRTQLIYDSYSGYITL